VAYVRCPLVAQWPAEMKGPVNSVIESRRLLSFDRSRLTVFRKGNAADDVGWVAKSQMATPPTSETNETSAPLLIPLTSSIHPLSPNNQTPPITTTP
jgi:hypothetical protein